MGQAVGQQYSMSSTLKTASQAIICFGGSMRFLI